MDLWRLDNDTFVRFWEDRFIIQHGYLDNTAEAVKALMKEQGLKPADITRAVLYTHDARRHQQLARQLGFDYKTQVQDSLFSNVGNTGAAYALMMLAGALEQAGAGEQTAARQLWRRRRRIHPHGHRRDRKTVTATGDKISP
jgi:hydroxymethylglutaryl-CoA synthase